MSDQIKNRYFVVSVDNATDTQCEQFTKSLQEDKNLGYWHWMKNTWILQDPYDSSTPLAWRLKCERFMPSAFILVVEMMGATGWAVRGPVAGNEWLIKNMNGQPTV